MTRRSANGAYVAPAWLPGGHAQTIYPSLKRGPEIAYRRERVDTPDGDFVDFDWLDATGPAGDATPVVALFHGLEGNSSSHYALALMRELVRIGWRGVVPHFRGCSGEPNRRPRAYHSGDHAEVGWMLATVRERVPFATLFAAGVSLGGSALLNWLGREEGRAMSIVTAAAAVSTPLDLNAAGIAIEIGLNRIYSRHFLGTLVPKAIGIAQRFPGLLDSAAIARANSMYAFDDVVTAPLHGFAGTQDYWTRASSKQWLKGIAVPTLVINARNDPFIPASSLPTRDEASNAVTLEQPEHGGHGGFPQPSSFGSSWLSHRLTTFFQSS